MSAHAIASATISFGLVSVPIQLYSTGEPKSSISFNWLHKKDGSRLKQQYVCAKDGEKVERDEMVKGYEFAKGQYVIFTPEELKLLEEQATGSINITEFVDANQVDRLYVDRTYYLGAAKGGERAYRLLGEAMKQTNRVAVGQYAARGKQYLVCIRPVDGGALAMEQLRYADEVRPVDEVPVPQIDVKKQELDLALQLVNQATSEEFRPEAYEDNVRKRMMEQIQRKVEGQEITAEPEEEPKAQVIDLMEALKASLAKGSAKSSETKAADEKPAEREERGKGRKRKVAGR
jgi:DNA end-binding protein Ku